MKKTINGFMKALIIGIALIIAVLISLIAVPGINNQNSAYAYFDPEEIYYLGGGSSTNSTETVNFATRTDTVVSINTTFPHYYNTDNALTNNCANVAGSIILGYYDRYYDLIPNCTPGVLRGGKYTYFPMQTVKTAILNTINELYVEMGINSFNDGATQTQYTNGLSSYVGKKNRNISFSSVMTNSALDMDKVANAISSGNPISLFLSGFNICELETTDTQYTIKKDIYTDNHIMVAYGYRIVNYYNDNGEKFRTDTFLLVSSGRYEIISGLYLVGSSGTMLNAAESAYIY